MKVIFNKNELLEAIVPAAAVSPVRNTLSSIEGILFECPGDSMGECRITAYDMEKGLRTKVDCKILKEGSIIINSQSILQIVRSLPDGEIMFSADEKNHVSIVGGNSSFEINATSADAFPALPLLSGDRNYTMPQHVLRELINKTVTSVSTAEMKAALAGVCLRIKDGKVRAVGCDGNRLALAETDIGGDVPDSEVIIPGRILTEMMKTLKDSEDDVTISLARKHVIFRLGEFTYFSRMIDGEYLNYERFLNGKGTLTVFVSAPLLRGAIERASLITEDKFGGSRRTFVKLDIDGKVLKISSSSASGSVYEELDIASEGEGFQIGFNCRFLMDALRGADDAGTIKIELNTPKTGILITKADGGKGEKDVKDEINYLFFVVPVNMPATAVNDKENDK